MKQLVRLAVIALLFHCCCPFLFGRPADLDSTFGYYGVATAGLGGICKALALQSDGKIVLGGFDGSGHTLVRYDTNGLADTTFGSGGKVTTKVGIYGYVATVAVQGDGKIVAAGGSGAYSAFDTIVIRYNADGTLDAGFGNGGIVLTDLGGDDRASSLAVQSDGKILVGASTGSGPLVVRFNPNGTVDSSFGTAGRENVAGASALALQPDGKIVLMGTTSGGDFSLCRLNANGTPDLTFGTGGEVVTNVGGQNQAESLALQSDGKIVVVGSSSASTTSPYLVIVRYSSAGVLDPGFGSGGKVVTPMKSENSGYITAAGVTVQRDGKIVVAAFDHGFGAQLLRYDGQGVLDTDFAADGKVTTPVYPDFAAVSILAVQSNGQIVVAGGDSPEGDGFAVARYLGGELLKPALTTVSSVDAQSRTMNVSFTLLEEALPALVKLIFDNGSTHSVLTLGAGFETQGDHTLTFDPNDPYAGGLSGPGLPNGTYTVRLSYVDLFLNPAVTSNAVTDVTISGRFTGAFDLTFGQGGKATTMLSSLEAGILDMKIQADGKIVASGYSGWYDSSDFALARYNRDGTLDTGFGNGGKVTTDLGAAERGEAVALQADGKIVVAGSMNRFPESDSDFALVRYNADGTIDNSFGNGVVLTDFGGDAGAAAVAVQPDGKIVAAGGTYDLNGSVSIVLARYNANGTLDSSFGIGGKVVIPNGAGTCMAIQSDGKILVAGASGGQDGDFIVVRLNVDGTLDNSFGTGGQVTTALGGTEDTAYSMVLQSDGRIVVAGSSGTSPDIALAVVRYHADGTLDSGFGNGGKVVTSAAGVAHGVALQSDGKIVVAGGGTAVVRYNPDGSLDAGFGSGGKLAINFGGEHDSALRVAVLPGGNLLVAGSSWIAESPYYSTPRICPGAPRG